LYKQAFHLPFSPGFIHLTSAVLPDFARAQNPQDIEGYYPAVTFRWIFEDS